MAGSGGGRIVHGPRQSAGGGGARPSVQGPDPALVPDLLISLPAVAERLNEPRGTRSAPRETPVSGGREAARSAASIGFPPRDASASKSAPSALIGGVWTERTVRALRAASQLDRQGGERAQTGVLNLRRPALSSVPSEPRRTEVTVAFPTSGKRVR